MLNRVVSKVIRGGVAAQFLLFPFSLLADPAVTIDSVLQRYPWSNVVDVRYTVSGVEAGNLLCGVEFTATVDDVQMSAGRELCEGRDGTFTHQWTPPAGLVVKGCTMKAMIASAGSLTGDDYFIVDLATGAATEEGRLNRQEYSDARYRNDTAYRTTKMVFRKIPAGVYYVNSDGTTTANITNDYYMGVFPVTVAQHALLTNAAAEATATAANMKPVVKVSWTELRYGSSSTSTAIAQSIGDGLQSGAIANLGSRVASAGRSGIVFDLPTDAMWEVAARAMESGDDSHAAWDWFFSGTVLGDASTTNEVAGLLRNYAWFELNANNGEDANEDDGYGTKANGIRVVGAKLANPWGLFDIYGNSYTWCLDVSGARTHWGLTPDTVPHDAEQADKRRVRGGSYLGGVANCRSYQSSWTINSKTTNGEVGYRLVMIKTTAE